MIIAIWIYFPVNYLFILFARFSIGVFSLKIVFKVIYHIFFSKHEHDMNVNNILKFFPWKP